MKRTLFLSLSALALLVLQPAVAQVGTASRPAAKAAAATQAAPDPAKLTQQQLHEISDAPTLYRLAAFYQQTADMTRLAWTLEKLARVVPMSGDVKLALASAYSNLGEKSRAYETLIRMQTQGYGYNLVDDPRFKKVADTQVWEYAIANLRNNLKSFGEGSTAFTLPKGEYLFESLAWDPKRERFLVGSVREGKIYLSDKNGKIEDFISPSAENGLWSIYALATDPARDLLYVASTASAYYTGFKAEDFGQAGIFTFKLSTGAFIGKVLLPKLVGDGNTLSSIAVSKKGQVFAADGLRNIVYKLDGKQMRTLVKHPRFTSIRGMTVSDDDKSLYFADYSLGLYGVDLSNGKPFDVDYDMASLVLPGIESVFWYQGTLIVIESGMSPKRVMRLHLSKDGRKIERAMALDAGNRSFTLPTNGTIVGDALYFFPDSHKNFYDKYGVSKSQAAATPQHVFRSNLRFAWDETLAKPVLGTKDPNAPKVIGAESPQAGRDLLNGKAPNFDNVINEQTTSAPKKN